MSTMTEKPNVHEKGALAFDEKKRILRLTSFAATGGVGSEILKQAANAHHEITAVVGNPKKLSGTVPDLQVITANLAAAEPKTIARRYAAQPHNQRTIGNWIRQFAQFLLDPPVRPVLAGSAQSGLGFGPLRS